MKKENAFLPIFLAKLGFPVKLSTLVCTAFALKKKKKKKDETRREMKHYVPKLNHRGAYQKAEKFPRR